MGYGAWRWAGRWPQLEQHLAGSHDGPAKVNKFLQRMDVPNPAGACGEGNAGASVAGGGDGWVGRARSAGDRPGAIVVIDQSVRI